MRAASLVPALASLAAATITITDPSDYVGTTAWESDNAILADYSPPPVSIYHDIFSMSRKH